MILVNIKREQNFTILIDLVLLIKYLHEATMAKKISVNKNLICPETNKHCKADDCPHEAYERITERKDAVTKRFIGYLVECSKFNGMGKECLDGASTMESALLGKLSHRPCLHGPVN